MTLIERRRARLLELYGFAFPEELERIYSFCRFLKPLDPLSAQRWSQLAANRFDLRQLWHHRRG